MAIKRIDDMTDEEVLALADEQIDQLIDYECALAGVPLLPPCPVRPEVKQFKPDSVAYQIAGYAFRTSEEAASILEAFQKVTAFSLGYIRSDYEKKILEPLDRYHQIQVTPIGIYSQEMADARKAEIDKSDRDKKAYEEAKQVYDDAFSKRKEHHDKVWNWIEDVRAHEYERQNLLRHFEKYLALANGDRAVALNFLCNAYEVPEKVKAELDAPNAD